jgi:hypothetical protein
VLHPFEMAIAFVDRTLEALERFLFHSFDRVHARNVIKELRIFRIEVE